MKALAQSVSHLVGLEGKTQSCLPEDAEKIWGAAVAHVMGSNSLVSGAKAIKLLGWNPQSPSIQAEIEQGSYRFLSGEN